VKSSSATVSNVFLFPCKYIQSSPVAVLRKKKGRKNFVVKNYRKIICSGNLSFRKLSFEKSQSENLIQDFNFQENGCSEKCPFGKIASEKCPGIRKSDDEIFWKFHDLCTKAS
jgi:hypothetical protein